MCYNYRHKVFVFLVVHSGKTNFLDLYARVFVIQELVGVGIIYNNDGLMYSI
jgi:hypothetical protein